MHLLNNLKRDAFFYFNKQFKEKILQLMILSKTYII